MKRRHLAAILVFATGCAKAQTGTPRSTSICGTVVDETGRPAAKMTVAAFTLGGGTGMLSYAIADANGRYCVHDLIYAPYVMTADDPVRGYPQMVAYLSWHSPLRPVTLTYAHPHATVNFRIPFKAAALRVMLTDAATSKPIPAMEAHLGIKAYPQYKGGGSGGAEQLIYLPPNQAMTLWLTSPGYSRWPDDGTFAHTFTLPPGETRTLRIALKRLP